LYSVLYFGPKDLALGYLLFSFLSALGVLQCIAIRYQLVGLAFLEDSEHRTRGYGLAASVIGMSALWFLASQWKGIFAPGPAGAELCLLFGTGCVCALATTLITASLLEHLRNDAPLQTASDGSLPVTAGSATGHLYTPPSPTEPVPAVCIVPWPGASADSMSALARHMVQEGMVILTIDVTEELCSYPGILALLPAAMSLLSKRPAVDPHRLGALGHDLGGDLVIRGASSDKQIRAIVALAPVLLDPPVGLDLLHEMSYPRAQRWSRDPRRAKVRIDLDALNYAAKIASRPMMLMYGARDRLVTKPAAEMPDSKGYLRAKVIPDCGHFCLMEHPVAMRIISQWFKEHL